MSVSLTITLVYQIWKAEETTRELVTTRPLHIMETATVCNIAESSNYQAGVSRMRIRSADYKGVLANNAPSIQHNTEFDPHFGEFRGKSRTSSSLGPTTPLFSAWGGQRVIPNRIAWLVSRRRKTRKEVSLIRTLSCHPSFSSTFAAFRNASASYLWRLFRLRLARRFSSSYLESCTLPSLLSC